MSPQSYHKFPDFSYCLHSAETYANASINFTHSYSGWEDEAGKERQLKRIVTGRFGQEWFYKYLKINSVPCKMDNSSPEKNDSFDIMIDKRKIDVKTSVHPGFVGQVSPGCYRRDDLYAYCFLLTDQEYSFIEPIGFVMNKDKEMFYHIPYGENIRDTGFPQKFREGSWFIDPEKMMPFFYFVMYFMNGR